MLLNSENERMDFRVSQEGKSLLVRAAAITNVNLTEFVKRHLLVVAADIIEKSEKIKLSRRDSMVVLDALENPPAPNEKLLNAARQLPKK